MSEKDMEERKFDYLRYKDTLDRLYKCRDLEISNLWQRSVFLAVFMTLTLSGYGTLLMSFFNKENSCTYPEYRHLAAIVLGILGFTFSVIWVLMSKGSKAWYEVYAQAIGKFEKTYKDKLGIPDGYVIGIQNFSFDEKDNPKKLTTINSGPYSVSKLNILIGWVFLILWGIIILVHSLMLVDSLSQNFTSKCQTGLEVTVLLIAIVITFINMIVFQLKYRSKSSYFNK